jgi:DNA-binding SARP family transcriptional activator
LAEGPRLIRQLKQSAPRTPLLVLAEAPSPREIIRAYDSGADGYLLLPLDLAVIRQKISTYLRPRHSWWRRFWWRVRRWTATPAPAAPPVPVRPDVARGRRAAATAGIVLRVCFFGTFSVTIEATAQLLTIRSKRVAQLFSCLLYHHRTGLTPERLMEHLWPDVPRTCARNSLNVALSQLRGLLSEQLQLADPIILERGKYQLAPALVIHSDLEQFNRLRAEGRRLEHTGEDPSGAIMCYRQALQYYRGDFLDTFYTEEWTAQIRDSLWENRLYLLERLCQYYFAERSYDQAIEVGRQLLDLDSCLEKVHRQLMLCYWHQGERGRALQQFAKCAEVLREELDAAPSAATRKVYDRIHAQ